MNKLFTLMLGAIFSAASLSAAVVPVKKQVNTPSVSGKEDTQTGPRLSTLDFEGVALPSENFHFTAAGGTPDEQGNVNTWFTSNNFKFLNRAQYQFTVWNGFTYSNVVNKSTAGYTNQYACITGGGINGTDGTPYLVGYFSEYDSKAPLFEFADGSTHILAGTYVTNSTYGYLAMKNGEGPARKFSKENKDWMKLTATGYDKAGAKGKSIDFYLADFRNEDDSKNYILDTWKWMDLSALGEIAKVEFTLSSSDTGEFGTNTPTYFCMDGLASITEDYPLPVYGEPVKTEGVTYDNLNMAGALSTPETSWLSTDNSVTEGNYFKASFKLGAFVFNHYWANWGFGGGFTYSNVTDVTTAGYTNMGSAAGRGFDGDTYLIAKSDQYTPAIASFEGEEEHDVLGTYITNSTYAYLSIKQGDDFAKKFGGAEGRDADWFKLTAIGLDKSGNETARTDFYLADYRFFDSTKDYALNEWKWFDLRSLGKVTSVKFELSSTDNGDYGMNTPGYFCMDNLIINHVTLAAIDGQETGSAKAYYADGAIRFTGLEGYHATVLNTSGAIITSFSIDSNEASIPLYNEKGIYLIHAEKEGKTITYKLVVR